MTMKPGGVAAVLARHPIKTRFRTARSVQSRDNYEIFLNGRHR